MKISFEDRRYPLADLPEKKGDIFGSLEQNVAYTFSGKSAISLVLGYYHSRGVLRDKSSQVLVPQWLGSWVYMTMHNYCFPTTVMNKEVKGIMVYHQWGFPQKMEKIMPYAKKNELFVLEDCAHSFYSFYKGERAGTFGDESIWSFSKFFPSIVGGAVYSRDADLIDFVRDSYKKSDAALEKKVFEHLIYTNENQTKEAGREVARNYAVYTELYSCPEYSTLAVTQALADGSLERRKDNFNKLREVFWSDADNKLIEDSDVYPWVVPLFFGDKNKEVSLAIQGLGIESGVYHFDVNRNMLNPHFVECVAVPCHQGLTTTVIGNMIDVIKGAL